MNTKPYNTEDEKIFRQFTDELEEWSRSGEAPSTGNQDIRYYLDLQKGRLKERNLKMEYRMKLRGEHLDRIFQKTYKDQIYTNEFVFSSYLQKTAFWRDEKKVYEKEKPQNFYQTITKMEQQKIDETYCCPSCGAVSSIKVLLDGCPYCHTRFLMSDLFPVVTGYFFQYDFSMNQKESKNRIKKWAIGGIILVWLCWTIPALIQGKIFSIFLNLLGSIPLGIFLGYLAMCMWMFMSLLGFAAVNIPRLFRTAGTKLRLNRLMKSYDKNFSYEYFIGRIVSLLKIMIFAEDVKELTVYKGEGEIPDLSEIVEAAYGGYIGLNKKWIENGYCYLDLDVYMADIYDKGKVYQKTDIFRMVVCRKLEKESDFGFSIRKVQCAGCGGSFDATRERYCPFCSGEYHLEEDDWAVIKIRKR